MPPYVSAEDLDDRNAAIMLPPGGGKTTYIISNSLRLAEQGVPFLVTTFARSSRNDIIERGLARAPPDLAKYYTRDRVHTLHSLCHKIMRRVESLVAGADMPRVSEDTIVWRTVQMLRDAGVARAFGAAVRIGCIYCDEAQDLSYEQYVLLMTLKTVLRCQLLMVGDPRQSIYAFRNASDRFLVRYGARTRTLYSPNNYRSTPQIVAFYRHLHSSPLEIVANRPGGAVPDLVVKGRRRAALDFIGDTLVAEMAAGRTVAVIGMRKVSKPYQDLIGLQAVVNYVEGRADLGPAAYELLYREHAASEAADAGFQPTNAVAKMCTIHGSKGLEFDTVLLIDVKELRDAEQENLFFVGASRAKRRLTMVTLFSYEGSVKVYNRVGSAVGAGLCRLANASAFPDEDVFAAEALAPRRCTMSRCEAITRALADRKLFPESAIVHLEDEMIRAVAVTAIDVPVHPPQTHALPAGFDHMSSLFGIFVDNLMIVAWTGQMNDSTVLQRVLLEMRAKIVVGRDRAKALRHALALAADGDGDGDGAGDGATRCIRRVPVPAGKKERYHFDERFVALVASDPGIAAVPGGEMLVRDIAYQHAKGWSPAIEIDETVPSLYAYDHVFTSERALALVDRPFGGAGDTAALTTLFWLALWLWQKDVGAGYRMRRGRTKYAKIARSMAPFVQRAIGITEHLRGLGRRLEHQHELRLSIDSFQFKGVADAVDRDDGTVYEFKFVSQLTTTHALQVAMYCLAKDARRGVLINVADGTVWEVSTDGLTDELYAYMSDRIQSFLPSASRRGAADRSQVGERPAEARLVDVQDEGDGRGDGGDGHTAQGRVL